MIESDFKLMGGLMSDDWRLEVDTEFVDMDSLFFGSRLPFF